ncbi:MAG TPA: hypothetical protein VI522_03290 [Gammaproteobacteria bacterium]|nr:hypothetical protein [Gammaproteobacteria bacterium]
MVNIKIMSLWLVSAIFSLAHAHVSNETKLSDIIVVETCEQLQAMHTNLDGNYVQTQDIDCQDYSGFKPIGTANAPFTGQFTGQQHKISHLTIYYPKGEAGLFGYTQDAQIEEVRLVDIEVTGGNYSTGALVGSLNRSLVFSCEVNGKVSSTHSNVGGMVGVANDSALLYVSAAGLVVGETNVGGLAGHASDSGIYDSYSASHVNGLHNVAGLIGLLTEYSEVMDAYAIGPVNGLVHTGGLIGKNNTGSVEASFWDKQSSQQQDSAGGIGYTTARMQNPNTYSGWDDTIWYFTAGKYPQLAWKQ